MEELLGKRKKKEKKKKKKNFCRLTKECRNVSSVYERLYFVCEDELPMAFIFSSRRLQSKEVASNSDGLFNGY